ncbi:MAG: hypothetical protein ACLVL7_10990 [Anaerotruncus massiliensis (ex Togo et al. 2019)]
MREQQGLLNVVAYTFELLVLIGWSPDADDAPARRCWKICPPSSWRTTTPPSN